MSFLKIPFDSYVINYSMQYRKFGNTDLLVSEIGFGAWAIGGGAMIGTTAIGWGDIDDNESKKAIHRSLELGINFFDTADIYGLGHSENLIGELLKNNKEVIIATKVGNVARNEQFTVDYSTEYILKACEESLKRLKRETIDYYQLHSARIAHLQQGDCLRAMELLQQQGKIRYWGISLNTFDPFPEAQFFLNEKTGNGFQLVLNILNQKALFLVQKASAEGYGIIARMPLQFGLLTGKFDNEFSFADNDHRKNRLTQQVIETANAALEPVWHLCTKYGVTKTELALSYILSYDEVSTVIPGIRTATHAEKNTTGLIKLDKADRDLIEQLGTTSFVPVMDMIQKQG
jgi:aryl-alcohol dehydrogenase-like predicted oxidoreductase